MSNNGIGSIILYENSYSSFITHLNFLLYFYFLKIYYMKHLSDTDILNIFKDFNLNYVQGSIIEYATDISCNIIDYKSHINHLLDIAVNNKPYNAVSRLGQGNKVVGLSYSLQPIWNNICNDYITIKKVQDIIYNVLIGNYIAAKNILNDKDFRL